MTDTCQGFLDIYQSDSLFGEVTNIGMNSEISISDLACKIGDLMDFKLAISNSNERIRPGNSEVERLVCDNSKLLKNTSWQPKYNLDQGITEIIKWMKNPENLTIYKSEKYNV